VAAENGVSKQFLTSLINSLRVLRDYTAGDPMDDTIRWTNLTHQQISDRLKEDYGIEISRRIVKQLFKKARLTKKRKAHKITEYWEKQESK